MKQYFLIIVVLTFFAGCEEEYLDNLSNEEIVISSKQYANASSDAFELTDAEIVGNKLKVTIRYSGGCGDIDMKLVGSEEIMESIPAKRNIRLLFNDDDDCEAYLTYNFEFDLTPAQVETEEQVILKLDGWDEALTYAY